MASSRLLYYRTGHVSPLASDFYAVSVEGNDNPPVDEVIRWLAGREGQDLVAKIGYAPCVPVE